MSIQRLCEHCATTFFVKPSVVLKGKGLFCSRGCWKNANTPEKRFWRNIDTSGGPGACWPWTGHRLAQGYGQFYVDGKKILTHRYAFMRVHGPLPLGILILHHCDFPPCCNEQHLFPGNDLINNHDMIAKGRDRHVTGEAHPHSSLTEDQVREARALQETMSQRAIAKHLNTTQNNVWLILHRRAWTHLP